MPKPLGGAKNEMLHVTLDTSCLYEIEEAEATTGLALGRLVELGKTTAANLRIPAICASERQKPGREITNFQQFRTRLANSGLGHAEILAPMAYIGMCFFDWALICGPEMEQLEEDIHDILFPSIPFHAPDYSHDDDTVPGKWRNAKCDVQVMWCHIYYHGDILVTRDRNFQKTTKKHQLEELGAKQILTPEDAVAEITSRGRVVDAPG